MAHASIMIVEDVRIVALNLKQHLNRMGYEVAAMAASGEEALRKARETHPQLVLMDIRIDGAMDGIETALHLQAENPVPVIYLTAYSGDETLGRARSTRPYGYLLKPFSERELQATLYMALGRRDVEIELEKNREELRAALAQVRELNDGLEERVRQRTADLHTAFRNLESFSAAVTHDLRAPLRSVRRQLGGMRDLVKEGESARQMLERADVAAHRMEMIIDGLLELARVTRVSMRRTQVDLSGMVRDIAAGLAADAGGRNVRFDIEAGILADCDRELVRIVLNDLLENAWKFTRKRADAVIAFGATTVDGERTYYVRDNGAGFDMNFADKLFGEFQRLHTATEFEGTGIGLATVRRIVERHGGHVSAQGAVGGGATFSFTLEPPAPRQE